MGAGIPIMTNPKEISQSLDVLISTSSAEILAKAFSNPLSFWAVIVATSASAVSSIFAFLTIRQNKVTQDEQVLQNLHNQFFEINRDLASRKTFTNHDNELFANFMDRVAELVEVKRVTMEQVSSFRSLTIDKDFVDFVKKYRSQHGREYYKSLTVLIKKWTRP